MRKLLLLFLILPFLIGAAPARTKTYTTGQVITASDVTENEDNIYSYLTRGVDTYADGSIVNADISASAAIEDSKLDTIETAGKVGLTALPTVTVPYGGTGLTTITDGGVLIGNGTGAIVATAVLSDGEILVGDGTTDPVAESGATLRTSIGVAIGSDVQGYDAQLADLADGTLSGASTVAAATALTGIVPLANGGTASTTGMHQVFTADGTFTAPVGVTTVYLTMVGSGGGGGGGNSTGGNGTAGGDVTFNTVVVAKGGSGGAQGAGAAGAGGGTGLDATSTGTGIGVPGVTGGAGFAGSGAVGGAGGASGIGNGGVGGSGTGVAGAVPTLGFGGGGGGGGTANAGSGGGGGQAIINMPYTVVAESGYAVVVGAAGVGGTSASPAGGDGKKGVCIVAW